MHRLPLALASTALLATVACSSPGADDGSVRVATTIYPLRFVAEEVGGDHVEVTNVTPPGAEPHDVELGSDQVIEIAQADLVVFIGGGFQPAVEESLDEANGEILDALALVASDPALEDDAHLWLDPAKLGTVADAIAQNLVEIDPENSAAYRAAADDLAERIDALDDAYRAGLRECESYDLVVAHEAFGQLGYGLEQHGISGLDPESEPSPRRIAELSDFVRANDVTTIFAERLLPADAAETIARETGTQVAILDPLESDPEEGDYFSTMEQNLEVLREGLRCR